MDLKQLPNIGAVLAGELIRAGIRTPELLLRVGAKEAFMRMRRFYPGACFSQLCALEGAVRGVRWHILPDASKADLRSFYEALKERDSRAV